MLVVPNVIPKTRVTITIDTIGVLVIRKTTPTDAARQEIAA
ncbi:MAG TPA: hypothetical protein VNY55_09030 [Mycobacterium sp.]|jgi:hypothetical protein|nr:hypothetical protein [Mycobacterium sp.]